MKSSLLSFFVLSFVCYCGASTIEITTTKVPNGTVDTAYSAVIAGKGGCTPYKWDIASGKLPSGITAKPSTKTIYFDLNGTPTKAASYNFTVSVTDCESHVAKQAYTLVIQNAPEHVVSVNWNASQSKNIAGYNVYRGPDGKSWTKINVSLIAATDYDDSTVSNGSTYYYSATSVNISGEESAKSTAVKVTVP